LCCHEKRCILWRKLSTDVYTKKEKKYRKTAEELRKQIDVIFQNSNFESYKVFHSDNVLNNFSQDKQKYLSEWGCQLILFNKKVKEIKK